MPVVAIVMTFLVTALSVFVLRPVAKSLDLLDHPGGRKRHERPVPLIGGIAMCLGITFGTVLSSPGAVWPPIALAIYLLVVVGTVDDRFDLPPGVRLIAQACAALLVVFGAHVVAADLGAPIYRPVALGPFGELFSILFIITLINAYNVIDGIDGLAGGLALVALLGLAIVGSDTQLGTLVLILVAAVAAFLLFNLPLEMNRQFKVFMGDAGSTFLGLSVATLGIALSQGPAATITPPVGLWFIAVPVFDLFSAVVRRVVQGRSVFAPDHEHLHHALLAAGLSRRGALVVMLGIAVTLAGFGLFGWAASISDGSLVTLWLGANVGYYQIMRRPEKVVELFRAGQRRAMRRSRAQSG